MHVNTVNIILDYYTSTGEVSCRQRGDCARRQRPPLAEPGTTPGRTLRASGWLGLQGIISDDLDPPPAACDSPTEPWHLHMQPADAPRLHPHPSPAASGGLGVIARHWQGSQQPTCAIDSYSSRCVWRCAAIAGIRASSAMRALGACSLAPRSSMPTGPRSALERVYASPPFPTGTSSAAPLSASWVTRLSTRQHRPITPQYPLRAS
jgi:hypothetical protein